MNEPIIPIDEIRKAAQEAALQGISVCPDKYVEHESIWIYELRVANYELQQVPPLIRAGLSQHDIVRLHAKHRFAFGQGEGA